MGLCWGGGTGDAVGRPTRVTFPTTTKIFADKVYFRV
jgi:hypothetical protein